MPPMRTTILHCTVSHRLPSMHHALTHRYSVRDGSLTYTGGVFNLPAIVIIAAMTGAM